MRNYKSYTSVINANKDKMEYLNSILSDLEKVSKDIFESKESTSDLNTLYKPLREKYPQIPSKILQNFIRIYKLDSKSPLKPGIYLDQNFNIQFKDSSFCSIWLRFSKRNFPLFGKHIIENIKDIKSIKRAHIYRDRSKIRCILIVEKEIKNDRLNPNSDKSESLSNMIKEESVLSKFPTLERRKLYRGKSYRKIKDFIHKVTSEISNKLQARDVEVLHIEDEPDLYRSLLMSASFDSKYALSMFPLKTFKRILIDKCLVNGIAYKYCTE